MKNPAREPPEKQPYLVDSISGATLTSQGVDNLMQFWFGDHGFKPFIDRIRNQGGLNG
jgi:Na+-transporting NADH:ubiquinone oxidoreductase subunit C